MKEIGEALRKRREELGLSLDEMSIKTRISQAQLKALEEGDLDYFKDDISYVRYFIRFYCQALDLDFEPFRDLLIKSIDGYTETLSIKAIQQREETQNNIEKKIARTRSTMKKEKRKLDPSLLSMLGVIALMAVCVLVVGYKILPGLFEPKEPSVDVPKIEVTPSATPDDSQDNPLAEPTPSPIVEQSVLTIGTVDPYNYEISGWKEGEAVTIELRFAQDTWMAVLYDNIKTENPASKIYKPNEEPMVVRFEARKDLKVTLHFGYIRGCEITINGQPFALDPVVADITSGQKINFVMKGE